MRVQVSPTTLKIKTIMTVNELVQELNEIVTEGKGEYDVIASTQDGGCYDVNGIREGKNWIELD